MGFIEGAPKTVAELDKLLKYDNSIGAFPVYKASFKGGSIWTAQGSEKFKIYRFYSIASNTVGSLTRAQLELALSTYNAVNNSGNEIGSKTGNKNGNKNKSGNTTENNFDWKPVILIGISVATLMIIFND